MTWCLNLRLQQVVVTTHLQLDMQEKYASVIVDRLMARQVSKATLQVKSKMVCKFAITVPLPTSPFSSGPAVWRVSLSWAGSFRVPTGLAYKTSGALFATVQSLA